MAKKRNQVDERQMSFLDLIREADDLKPEASTEGSLNIQTRLCHSLTNAIKDSGFSRFEIAGKLSHLLGVEVSKFQIDAWTAESKDGHRFPAEYLPALCHATGSREPLKILSEAGGMYCLPGPEALRSEIHKFAEEERRMRAEKLKREKFLREMEG